MEPPKRHWLAGFYSAALGLQCHFPLIVSVITSTKESKSLQYIKHNDVILSLINDQLQCVTNVHSMLSLGGIV